jgi:hypothetical protein
MVSYSEWGREKTNTTDHSRFRTYTTQPFTNCSRKGRNRGKRYMQSTQKTRGREAEKEQRDEARTLTETRERGNGLATTAVSTTPRSEERGVTCSTQQVVPQNCSLREHHATNLLYSTTATRLFLRRGIMVVVDYEVVVVIYRYQ